MGNIHSEVSNHVERIALGDSGVIVVRKTKKSRGRQVEDAWTAEYSVEGTTCEVGLTKTNRNKHDEELSISLHDHAPDVDLQMDIRVEEDFLVSNLTLNGPRSLVKLPDCKSGNPLAQGGVLKSTSYFSGRDTDERKGLIIILRAKRSDDDEEWPYVITVKHYLVVSAASSSGVGLYVVAKICNDNGKGLSVQLEKPVKQNKRYLLSIFDDVKRNGWRPNYSNDFAIERSCNQNEGKVPVLSVGGKNNNPEPYGYYSMSGEQNVSSVISTSGYTVGNKNGSLIFENCHIWFDKDGKMFRSSQ